MRKSIKNKPSMDSKEQSVMVAGFCFLAMIGLILFMALWKLVA